MALLSYLFDNIGLIPDLSLTIYLSLEAKLASGTSKRVEEHNNRSFLVADRLAQCLIKMHIFGDEWKNSRCL